MNKNLRTVKVTITAQTQYHLQRMAIMCGWRERDMGRVIDKLVRSYLTQQANITKGEKKNA